MGRIKTTSSLQIKTTGPRCSVCQKQVAVSGGIFCGRRRSDGSLKGGLVVAMDLMSSDEAQKLIGRNPKTKELEIFCLGDICILSFMFGRFCSRFVGKAWESSIGAFSTSRVYTSGKTPTPWMPKVRGEEFKDVNLRMHFFKLFSGAMKRKKNMLKPQKFDQRHVFLWA